MSAPRHGIRRRLMAIMLTSSAIILLATGAAFLTYDTLTFRQVSVLQLATLGKVLAANSTAALAFVNTDDATEVLSALRAEPHIRAAALYDREGRLFAWYPAGLAPGSLPPRAGSPGYRFESGSLIGIESVVEAESRPLGMLYLEQDLGLLKQRFRLFGGIALLGLFGGLALAYVVALRLQRRISAPILALADTARAISDRGDYTVRAAPLGQDELGVLTDAFNRMLDRIDAQKQDLVENQRRLRSALDAALSAVVLTDGEGSIIDWNVRAEAIFEMTLGEVTGELLPDLIIPPGSRDVFDRITAALGGSEDRHHAIELTVWRQGRREFTAELSASLLRTGTEPLVCWFITDITERKQSELRLHTQLSRLDLLNRITRAIGERLDLESIFEVVLQSLDENLRVDFSCLGLYYPESERVRVVARRGAEGKMLGLEPGSEVPVGENGLQRCVQGRLVHEPDLGQSRSSLAHLAGHGLRSLVAAPLLLESQVFGVLLVARSEAHRFTSPDCEFLRQLGEQVGLASHQAQVYQALQQAYDELRKSQQTVLQQERLRALGQMASGIAHDINNAISPVALYTQALLEGEEQITTRGREYLRTIERAIEDVAGTVARMREFYRPREAEAMLLATDLNPLVQQVLDLTRARWSDMPQQQGIVIETRTLLDPALPRILGTDGEIREALTNLVFNATDAMLEGGTITLRTGVRASGEHRARAVFVEVTDTGIGMDEETRRRCLEPFYTTKGERGTGLGLAMVYGMIQRHGGEIEIESEPGTGTTMRLLFAPAPERERGQNGTGVHHSVAALRILIVDDDPLVLKALRDTLESDGHLVTAAPGGEEGIAAFRKALDGLARFEVVITDLGMPRVDGRRVASAVKNLSPETPVILLTGWGQRLAADNDVPSEVDHLLSKPPRLRELRDTLSRCIGDRGRRA